MELATQTGKENSRLRYETLGLVQANDALEKENARLLALIPDAGYVDKLERFWNEYHKEPKL